MNSTQTPLLWALIGFGIGGALGYLFASASAKKAESPTTASKGAKKKDRDEEPLAKFEGNYKMVLVVNTRCAVALIPRALRNRDAA